MSGPLLYDRVRETSVTTGTGTLTLAGAVSGYQAFSVVGNGNTCHYCITGGAEWEVGTGTYTSSGTTLSRTTVLASSNAGALVSLSAGTKTVFLTAPADTLSRISGAFTDGQVLVGQTSGSTLSKKTLSGAATMDKDGVVTLTAFAAAPTFTTGTQAEIGPFDSAVISGLAVTWTSGMGLSVSAGVARCGGKRAELPSAVTLTIAAADASNPRWDAICMTWAGFPFIIKGTAAATPLYPTLPKPGQTIAGDSGTTTSLNSNALNDTGKSWTSGQWVGWTAKLTGTLRVGEMYRPIKASGSTFAEIFPSWHAATLTAMPYSIFLSDVTLLALVYVPAAASALSAASITDTRVFAYDRGIYNLLAYYAKGDETQNDRDCLQHAVICAGRAGGGTVVVPRTDQWYDLDTGTLTGANSTTLTDSGKSWVVNAYAGYYVRITSGSGSGNARGQVVRILSNTATVLTFSTAAGMAPAPSAGVTYAISRYKRYLMDVPTTYDGVNIDYPNVHIVGQPGAVIYTPTLESAHAAIRVRGKKSNAVTTVNNTTETNTATSATASTLTRSTATWTVNQWAGFKIVINSGTGAGQPYRQVISNTSTVLTIATTWVTTPDATSNYTIGDLPKACGILTVASATALAADDYISLRSSGEVFNDERSLEYKGEFQRVRSVPSATQVVLTGGTYDSYQTNAYTVNVDRYDFLENVEVRDLEMLGNNADQTSGTTDVTGNSSTTLKAAGSPGWTVNQYANMTVRYLSASVYTSVDIISNTADTLTFAASSVPDNSVAFNIWRAMYGIWFQYVRDCRVNRCRLRQYKRGGVFVDTSTQISVLDCDIRGHNENAGGYGVLLQSVDGGLISGNHFIDGRHAADVSYTTGANGGVVSRNVVIRDNIVYDHKAAGISTHGSAEIITISGNKVSNCYGGIAVRSRFTNVVDNHVYSMSQQIDAAGTTAGISVGETAGTVGNGGQGLRIIGNYLDCSCDNTVTGVSIGISCLSYLQTAYIAGNRIIGVTGHGIHLRGYIVSDTIIQGNFIDGTNQYTGYHGIYVSPSTPGNGHYQSNLTLANNVITNVKASGLTIDGNSTAQTPSDAINISSNTFDQHGTQAIVFTNWFRQISILGNTFSSASSVSGSAATEALNIASANVLELIKFDSNFVSKGADEVINGTSKIGTVGSGSTTANLVSQAITSVATNLYAGYTIRVLSGTGINQWSTIVSHTSGTTPTFTIDKPWTTAPANNDTYSIYRGTRNDSALRIASTGQLIVQTDGPLAYSSQPIFSYTIPANYVSQFFGLPYRVSSGVIITVCAGSILRIGS